MKRQDIYDKVKAHAMAQPRRARAKNPTCHQEQCAYLADNGDKCFIGALLPDGHPAQHFFGDSCHLVDTFPDLKPLLGFPPESPNDPIQASFLSDLQHIHDSFEPYCWANQLTAFANNWNLTA